MAAVSASLFTSKSDRWCTPPDLLAEIGDFLGDYYDPCPAVALGEPVVDGLVASCAWRGQVFVNPPYGRQIGAWVEKWGREPMLSEGILLVPARTDTQWFAPLWRFTICFVRGRLHFSGHKDSAPFPSVLVYRGWRPASAKDAFAQLAQRGPVTRAMRAMWKVERADKSGVAA